MLQRYRASGRCGSTFYLAVLGLICLAAAAGWIYQKVVDAVPFIYVNFLLTLGLGFLITWGLGKVLAIGRCRSAVAALVAGLVVAAAALGVSHYSAFSSWQSGVLDVVEADALEGMRQEGRTAKEQATALEEIRAEVIAQTTFSQYLDDRLEYGWTIGSFSSGLELSGLFVWLVWAIEAGILFFAGWKGAGSLKGAAYCENCDRWAETLHDQILSASPKRADIAAIRGATTAAELFPAGTVRFEEANSHLLHSWKECDECRQAYLDVAVLTYVPNDKGEVKTEVEVLHSNLVLEADLKQAFEEAAEAAREAEKAALTPPEPDAPAPD